MEGPDKGRVGWECLLPQPSRQAVEAPVSYVESLGILGRRQSIPLSHRLVSLTWCNPAGPKSTRKPGAALWATRENTTKGAGEGMPSKFRFLLEVQGHPQQ